MWYVGPSTTLTSNFALKLEHVNRKVTSVSLTLRKLSDPLEFVAQITLQLIHRVSSTVVSPKETRQGPEGLLFQLGLRNISGLISNK